MVCGVGNSATTTDIDVVKIRESLGTEEERGDKVEGGKRERKGCCPKTAEWENGMGDGNNERKGLLLRIYKINSLGSRASCGF